ncbi:sigma-70 family RNA polymerase sigma factor [Roseiconus lacunae]|uniref:Sigma-70 family RNA polymerase sigma factor n=1 Tax=Roseiconus lacunae TaxID=2605694 RepID=A0ABT7PKE2_9BACT|nr:sigma-70 family RNA polymerase sigma factor [Roseiconus lacunae]MCD0461056.1 sigma-70 family RNA polymerase sigma factor [Roseiconus lacunae]MDM4016959.1 sigma-70 family RNA polymerase sigma factor [Roseiconus lacunae]WRQ48894.1 sigma-70 family RNA polymerase sigma factor [Stieleria sp. HD01]
MVATSNRASDSPATTEHLIGAARQLGGESLGELLELYRNYLAVLATTQMDNRLRRRIGTSDLVQETMLAAHSDFGQFRGNSEGELVAWLRQILCNSLRHAIEKHVHARKRDVRREMALDNFANDLDDSFDRLSRLAVDPDPTPSQVVMKQEIARKLADELAKLKPRYREIIIYRNLQSLTFDEIAVRMEIKSGAARMLWLRAIAKFKEVCELGPEAAQ